MRKKLWKTPSRDTWFPGADNHSRLLAVMQAAYTGALTLLCLMQTAPVTLINSWNSWWKSWTETCQVSSSWAPVVLSHVLCSLPRDHKVIPNKWVNLLVYVWCVHLTIPGQFFLPADNCNSFYCMGCNACSIEKKFLKAIWLKKKWILTETGCWRAA